MQPIHCRDDDRLVAVCRVVEQDNGEEEDEEAEPADTDDAQGDASTQPEAE